MDSDSVQIVSTIAETITTIGVLLLWIYAERKDNQAAWTIIDALVRLRMRQLEHEYEDTIKAEVHDKET